MFELRAGSEIHPSPSGELSYIRTCALEGKPLTHVDGEPNSAKLHEQGSVSDKSGLWSVGNLESKASLVVVHGRDPLPPFYDPSNDGFTGDLVDELGSFVDGMPSIYIKV